MESQMKMFGKNTGSTDAASNGAKRDVTLSEPQKRPDHVRVESDECTWKIGLTLDEQHSLGSAYEWNENNGEFDKNYRDEASFLRMFTERIYRECAKTITLEIKPIEPGKVSLKVESNNPNFSAEIDGSHQTISYGEVGALILKWIEVSQSRKELIADLVTSLQRGDA
jgi:hypothetical protein